jgi:hypothetical protein
MQEHAVSAVLLDAHVPLLSGGRSWKKREVGIGRLVGEARSIMRNRQPPFPPDAVCLFTPKKVRPQFF